MPTSINTFKLFTEFCANKAQAGGTVSPSQLGMLGHQAQLQLFERDRSIFLETGVSSYYLDYFIKNLTVGVPPTGTLTYPSDWIQTSSIRKYYVPPTTGVGIEVPVEEVENKEYGEISASQLMLPTLEFPKYSDFNTDIRFLPKDIGIIMMDYWRLPVAPVWGYTTVSGRPVYDPSTSTDFEWSENYLNEVAGLYLALIGINLREGELSQFAEMYKQQNNSPK